MGALYSSSRPSHCHMNHDGFCIVDDRSCISFATKHRSASYSRTASSLYHSFLLVICRVGHVHDASNEQSLPGIGDQVKIAEGIEKAKHKREGLLAPSTTTNVRGLSVSCGAGTSKLDNILTGSIHQSRITAGKESLGSLASGDTANIDNKPRLKPASLGDKQMASPAKPLEGSSKDRHIAESRSKAQKVLVCPVKININAAAASLHPSPSPMPLVDHPNGRESGLASVASRFAKRQRDDSDDEITQIPVRFKKAMRRTQNGTVSVQQHDVNVVFSAALAEPSDRPSAFDTPRWLNVNWKSLTFAAFNYSWGPNPGIQVSLAVSDTDSAQLRPAPLSWISTIKPVSSEPDASTGSFVSAIQVFDELVGSCDALVRFAENAGKCLANNRDGVRCGSSAGLRIEDRPTVGKLLEKLKDLNLESNPSSCVNKLAALTNLAVCKWQRKGIREKVKSLQQRQQFEQLYDTGVRKYLPRFLPYRPPESRRLTSNEFAIKIAREPFDASSDGYLYVYWNEATFGVRKIGYTTQEVSKRLQQWETGCKNVAAEQYRSPCKVRHAARVEQLVHADLLDSRVFEPACHACLASHIEWFRGVDLPFIIGRIEAWSQWINEGSYQYNGRQWHLTEKGRDRMPILADPNSCRDPDLHTRPPANLS